MNVIPAGISPEIRESDALLMDVARRIQLSKTKNETADRNFHALCQHVDRDGSPLQGKVVECYAGGSFATGTVIASQVSKDQHDVDVVIELAVLPNAPPRPILGTLFEAINGEPGSRYHRKVKLNSRCVTVEYDDGTSVDLMPIARFTNDVPRAGNLFHSKGETHYHKAVNPWGFADHFNSVVGLDPEFAKSFQGRRLLVEGIVKADTQPMPEQVPLWEKSPRVVALQLLKRTRDIRYRARPGRKPPSIALAAMSIEMGSVQPRLIDELIEIAQYIRTRLAERSGPRGTLQVFNPAYPLDEFTDRWPENPAAQQLFDEDLRRLTVDLRRLRNDDLSLAEKQELLSRLFGETAALYAIESQLDSRRAEMESNRLRMGSRGKVLGGSVASTFVGATSAVRAATREGGGSLPE